MRAGALTLRDMRRVDVEEVGVIEAASFASPWSSTSFLFEMGRGGAWARVVADSEGRVVGYMVARLFVDVWHILDIAVTPEWRRRGVARLLMSDFLASAHPRGIEFTLEVRTGNVAAIALYADLGFEVVGSRRGYYADTGEDALLMTLPLEPRVACSRLRGRRREEM